MACNVFEVYVNLLRREVPLKTKLNANKVEVTGQIEFVIVPADSPRALWKKLFFFIEVSHVMHCTTAQQHTQP